MSNCPNIQPTVSMTAVILAKSYVCSSWNCSRSLLLSALGPTMSLLSTGSPEGLGVDPTEPLVPADLESRSPEELRVLKGKLWRALKDFRFARPTSFHAFGQEYPLPYSVTKMPLETPSEERLGYLSGFFAGDGCVKSDLSGLSVGQSVQGAEVLVLFTHSFGGSIGVQSSGSGTSFPTLHWQVSGSKSRRAAVMLGKAQLEKQAQLLQFSGSGPEGHHATFDMMRHLKQTPSKVKFQTWPGVAGFVDAEGCFYVTIGATIELCFGQKHRTSLDGLQRIFLEKLGVKARMSARSGDFTHDLAVGHKSTQKICQHLLEGGLLLKRAQAELALSHTSTNGLEIRAKLQELKGNQGRFLRRDSEGTARAIEISSLQHRRSYLRRSTRMGIPEVSREVDELTVMIDELKQQHQRKELERQILAMYMHLQTVRRMVVGESAETSGAETSAALATADEVRGFLV